MSKIAKNGKPYETRQVVAKLGKVGSFTTGGKSYFIPEYITFWTGEGPSLAAKFDRIADKDPQGVLRMENVKEGEIVVAPGFVYRKTPMTGMVQAAHLRAMMTFRPKTIVSHELDTAPPVDMGTINLNGVQ